MTKRTQHQLDPNVEAIEQPTFETLTPIVEHIERLFSVEGCLARLLESGVVTVAEGAISWREGHLEHVAALYVGDPALTWRDYADDLTVALAADDSHFAALVERARGE